MSEKANEWKGKWEGVNHAVHRKWLAFKFMHANRVKSRQHVIVPQFHRHRRPGLDLNPKFPTSATEGFRFAQSQLPSNQIIPHELVDPTNQLYLLNFVCHSCPGMCHLHAISYHIVSICIYMYLPMLQHAQTTCNASTYPCTSLPAWFPQPTMKWIHQNDQSTSQVAHPEPRNSRRSTRIGQWMRVFGIPKFNKHPHTYIINYFSQVIQTNSVTCIHPLLSSICKVYIHPSKTTASCISLIPYLVVRQLTCVPHLTSRA